MFSFYQAMDRDLSIEAATVNDAVFLSNLTKESKAFWGYSKQQIKEWNDELNITPDYIVNYNVFKILKNKEIIGYYSYFHLDNLTIQLDNIFIAPIYIRKGIGKILVKDLIIRVKILGYKKVVLNSDPNAEPFYIKMGFYVTGRIPGSMENRFLSAMEKMI